VSDADANQIPPHFMRLTQKLAEWGYQIDPPGPQPDQLAAYSFPYDYSRDDWQLVSPE
jgi:hypothetical protein